MFSRALLVAGMAALGYAQDAVVMQGDAGRSAVNEQRREFAMAVMRVTEEQFLHQMRERRRMLSLAGRTLTRIDVVGMSDVDREEILRRLPVRTGDTLSSESIGGVGLQVRHFQERVEHVDFDLQALENNGAVLKIAVPDFQRVINLDRDIAEKQQQLDKMRGEAGASQARIRDAEGRVTELKRQRGELMRASGIHEDERR